MKKRDNQIAGTPLNISAPMQRRYAAALQTMVKRMTVETERKVISFFRQPDIASHFAQDSVTENAQRFADALRDQFFDYFDDLARVQAERMAQEADRNSDVSVLHSLKEISQHFTLGNDFFRGEVREILQAIVAENVSVIKSIASQYLDRVEQAVARSIADGKGLADLVPFLHDQEGVTLRRANFIALDQTRRAYANLNQARMASVGITEYRWLHSGGGQHPRKLHEMRGDKGLNGNVYRFDDPPIIDERTGQRGKPGDMINCRCRMIPIVTFGKNAGA